MARFDHPIIERVAALKLPDPEEVVINHGAALVIRGVRKEHAGSDIDMSVNLRNRRYLLEELGWAAVRKFAGQREDGTNIELMVTQDSDEQFDVHRWDFSMWRYKRTGRGRIYLPEQKKRSEQDDATGIWVASLEYVRETKLDTSRPKDRKDVDLIDEYLARMTNGEIIQP